MSANETRLGDNRIAELRDLKGWSQAELAARVRPKTSAVQVHRYETGQRGLDLDWMRRFAAALDCSPSDLLIDDDVRDRLSPTERALMDALRAEPAYEPAEIVDLLKGCMRLLAKQGARRSARSGTLPGDPVTVAELADAWAVLDDRQRHRAVDLLRAAADVAPQAMAAE